MGYLWAPADAVFLPSVEEVTRGALLAAGRPRRPLPTLTAAVSQLVAVAMSYAAADRGWVLEFETDDDDVYVRLWMRLREARDLPVDDDLREALDAATGSYSLARDGTEFLAVLQVELAA